MPKYLYRVSLVHSEPTNAKSRTKNLGVIAQTEIESPRDVRNEVDKLREMTARPSWLIPSTIVVERSEVTDFVPVDIDTLEPARQDDSGPQALPIE